MEFEGLSSSYISFKQVIKIVIFFYWSIGHELTYAVEVIDEKLITNTVGGYQWLFGRDR